jgi:hypothetical protein
MASKATTYLAAMAAVATASVIPVTAAQAWARAKPGTPGDPVVLGCNAEAMAPQPAPQVPGPADLAAGPLIIPGGKLLAGADPGGYGQHGSYKVPFIIKMGASVTVTIEAPGRRYVRIENPYSPVGPVTAVTYHACPDVAGFYAQSFVFRQGRSRGCVPLAVKPVPGTAVRQLMVSLFAGKCPKGV